MISGKEKAQVLLSLIGPHAKAVLSHLSPESANLLSTSITNAPALGEDEVSHLVGEVTQELKEAENSEPDETELDPILSENDDEGLAVSAPVSEDEIDDNLEEITEPEEPEPTTPQTDYRVIADTLSKQRPQVIAFILNKMDANLRQELVYHIPAGVLEKAEQHKVEMIPLSERVFERIYQNLFKNIN